MARHSVRVAERDFTEDDYNRILGRNPRHRVVARRSGNPADIVAGYAAAQILGGKDGRRPSRNKNTPTAIRKDVFSPVMALP